MQFQKIIWINEGRRRAMMNFHFQSRLVLRCRRRVSVRKLIRVLLYVHLCLPLLVGEFLCELQFWSGALENDSMVQP